MDCKTRLKAAVNAPHSKRFATVETLPNRAKRLDCGGFSTAFDRAWNADSLSPPRGEGQGKG